MSSIKTLNDLVDLIPADLRMAVEAGVDDPGMKSGCDSIRSVFRSLRERRNVSDSQIEEWREDILSWITTQEFFQNEAAEVNAEIEETYPVDVNDDLLPEWIVEWWAPVLRNPWSERLDEAVHAAREWLRGNV